MKWNRIIASAFVLMVLLIAGCKENESGVPALVGTWIAPELGTTELTILPSHEFICKTNILTQSDSANYSIIRGTVKVTGYKLEFKMIEVESWNVFYPDKQPVIIKTGGSLFGDCTYMVKDNRLELNYTSYPADAPVPTQLILYRKS